MASIFDSFDPPEVYLELQALPASLTIVTPDTFRLLSIFLTNTTNIDREITITNAAGVALVQNMALPANMPAPMLQFPMMEVAGLRITPDGTGINCQVEGFPIV